MKFDPSPLFDTIHKINSKWIREGNIEAKTIKLIVEGIGVNFHDVRSSKGFLDMRPKAKATKVRNR